MTNDSQYFSAVIMVIDAVSYSKHMEINPDATLRAVQSAENFIENRLKNIDGRVFNKAGDSLLLIFANPTCVWLSNVPCVSKPPISAVNPARSSFN